ncbi:MAG: type I DNA topoisomerase, partial [Candidatus Latescibacteria bacterium]|nr:type I DNA topoisomerase [Candidatus Latescibacterota bacterium]
NTRPLKLGVPCLKEGCGGELVERSSRRGRTFYGCDRYPDCDFATWARPLKQECPSCSGPFLAEHSNRKGDSSVKCLKCKHTVPDGAQSQDSEETETVE